MITLTVVHVKVVFYNVSMLVKEFIRASLLKAHIHLVQIFKSEMYIHFDILQLSSVVD